MMPRLLAVEELSPDQHVWLYNNFDHHDYNSGLEEVIETDNTDIPIDSVNSYGHNGRPMLHPADVGSNGHHSRMHQDYLLNAEKYGSTFSPPRLTDNRSTIFRGRGGQPPQRNEYEQNQGYYQNQSNVNQHHHYPPPPFPPRPLTTVFPSPNTMYSDERRQEASPLRVFRKRDRSLENGRGMVDPRSDKSQHESPYYPNPYVYRHPMIPYFEPDETPNRKRPFIAPTTPTWGSSKEVDVKAKKFNPIYPHQGEKLTWQQSFENLQVYKKTYGVSLQLTISFIIKSFCFLNV